MMRGLLVGMLLSGLLLSAAARAAEGDKADPPKAGKAQETCPVMGGKINRDIFVDHEGKRVYLCCKGCIAEFKKDPAKYIKKLEDAGVTIEAAPAPDKKEAPAEPKAGACPATGAKGGCCG
jgi:YHS domain-containing protein